MKFKCFCDNVINATENLCKEVCILFNESEYILWIKFFLKVMNEYPDFKRAFFCNECKRYSVFDGEDLYVFKPSPVETTLLNDYETYHLMDEFEKDAILTELDDPQNKDEIIKFNFNSLPKTRMMNISFTEKKAYIENLDGSIETYILEREIKK